jgi:glycosyltransferase involved in cell wall biosynthesis
MRILLVTPLFFPSLSGAAVYFDTLSQALVKLDPASAVTILTRAIPGAPRREWRGPVRVSRLLPGRPLAPRARAVERLASVQTVVMALLMARLLRSDVVHYHTLVSYRAIHRLAPLFPAPLVGDMRDLAAKHEGASLRYYEHCSKLICASENILGFLRAAGFPADRLVHIPIPFVPPVPAPAGLAAKARARYGIPEGTPYLLFIGAIIPYKGVKEILAAMDTVWRDLPDLHLVLAGPLTPDGDALFPGGFRAAAGRDHRLHYVGPVPHEDIPLLVQDAAVFILPSRTEGLPRASLEAIALGRKVILPPGIPEFDAACPDAVLDEITPEAIARKITATWERGRPATYPLARHDATRVAALTRDVYRDVAR